MKHTKKVQRGFTLLELVVVIAVIGTLLVVAMPRLLSTSNDARVAAAGGVAGSLSAASAFNYSKRSAAISSTNSAVANCTDVGATLQGGALPSGYTITAAPITSTDGTAFSCLVVTTMTPVITTTFIAYGIN